jgi:hypothetical protein
MRRSEYLYDAHSRYAWAHCGGRLATGCLSEQGLRVPSRSSRVVHEIRPVSGLQGKRRLLNGSHLGRLERTTAISNWWVSWRVKAAPK